MRFKLDDLSDEHRKQAMDQLHSTVRGKEPKRDRQVALVEEAEVPKLNPPVRITISLWKKGDDWDTSNIEQKAIIDELVHCGVIPDDTIKENPQILLKGFRCETKAEEKTEVEVIEL